MRLLLAEDERELSRALVTILEHSSYTVDAVYNGADALDYLRSGLYDGAIRQMVGLLLDNAVKYADSDGDITLMLTRVGKRVELTVTNPCRSVAEGVHDEFFERFYRADASRNSETGGSGIGLSVVRAVAVAHGGKADFRSPDGKSVSVRVILPLRGK